MAMRRLVPFVVAVMAVVLGQGVAAASTATVSPGGPTTGTSAGVQWALRTTGKTLNCSTAGFTQTLASASGALPLAVATDMKWMFGSGFLGGSCTQTGGAGFTFTCSATASLNATGPSVAGVTPMQIRGFSCLAAVNGTTCSVRITGALLGRYNSAASQLTVNATGQMLFATGSSNGSGGTCGSLPNDTSVSLTDSSGASLIYAINPSTTLSVV
jgi:hypothetical protein